MSKIHEDLADLNARFEAEDAADAAAPEQPEDERDIVTYDGFASGGVTPRTLGDAANDEVQD